MRFSLEQLMMVDALQSNLSAKDLRNYRRIERAVERDTPENVVRITNKRDLPRVNILARKVINILGDNF